MKIIWNLKKKLIKISFVYRLIFKFFCSADPTRNKVVTIVIHWSFSITVTKFYSKFFYTDWKEKIIDFKTNTDFIRSNKKFETNWKNNENIIDKPISMILISQLIACSLFFHFFYPKLRCQCITLLSVFLNNCEIVDDTSEKTNTNWFGKRTRKI